MHGTHVVKWDTKHTTLTKSDTMDRLGIRRSQYCAPVSKIKDEYVVIRQTIFTQIMTTVPYFVVSASFLAEKDSR